MSTDGLLKYVETEVNKGIDDSVESLKWFKRHRHERKAVDALRLVQRNLGYLALALDWEMEGELAKAESALQRVWWQPSHDGTVEFDWMGH